jgi:hypothetical protein
MQESQNYDDCDDNDVQNKKCDIWCCENKRSPPSCYCNDCIEREQKCMTTRCHNKRFYDYKYCKDCCQSKTQCKYCHNTEWKDELCINHHQEAKNDPNIRPYVACHYQGCENARTDTSFFCISCQEAHRCGQLLEHPEFGRIECYDIVFPGKKSCNLCKYHERCGFVKVKNDVESELVMTTEPNESNELKISTKQNS